MAKEQFFYPATRPLFKKLEQVSQRSGVSRGQAFEDFLTAAVAALAAETMEDEYLAMAERHKRGKQGQRGIDLMPQMFAELIDAMSREDVDILGDLFQGALTYGESGQYFSPESVARLLAEMSVAPDARPTREKPTYVCDPACGTGRMLLAAADINPFVECVGVDIDARCARITSVNLGLRSRYGWVVCGNSLSGETQFAYRIGSFFNETPNGPRRGVIREVPPEETPVPVLASRLRQGAQNLFDQAEPANAQPKDNIEPSALPTIIEVPQWLNRLEPKLAALDRQESTGNEETPEPGANEEAAEPPRPRPDDRPPKQQELF